jgi:hypothetical protein
VNPNYTSGPATGLPTKLDPTSALISEGHQPVQLIPAQMINSWRNGVWRQLTYLEPIQALNWKKLIDASGSGPTEIFTHWSAPAPAAANRTSRMFAGAALGGVFRILYTDDDWLTIVLPATDVSALTNVRRIKHESSLILCAGGDQAGGLSEIWRTVDGGVNWINMAVLWGVAQSGFRDLFHDAGGVWVAAAENVVPGTSLFLFSVDSGATWNNPAVPPGAAIGGNPVLAGDGAGTLLAAGLTGIWRSVDNGNNWTQTLTIGGFGEVDSITWSPNTGLFVAVGIGTGVADVTSWQSTTGVVWTPTTVSVVASDRVVDVHSDDGELFVGVTAGPGDARIRFSLSRGQTWVDGPPVANGLGPNRAMQYDALQRAFIFLDEDQQIMKTLSLLDG